MFLLFEWSLCSREINTLLTLLYFTYEYIHISYSSVADPHRKNADADPGKNLNADADADLDADPDADSCSY